MSSKGGRTGAKRKATSSQSTRAAKWTKKPRVEAARKPFDADDHEDLWDREDGESGGVSEDGEDGEDGGAALNSRHNRSSNGSDKAPKLRNPEAKNGVAGAPAKAFERGANSRESHAIQRQLAQERKAAKPLADELSRTKKLWERLRRKSHVPREERQVLVDELFTIITGRIRDFVLKHDAVRAVQTALKYATPAQRKMIANELKGTYAQLAESRYAKFLIGKLLVQGDTEIRDLVVPEFYGRVRKLINHPEASWILDDVYRGAATKQQKAVLLREWYGTEFALFSAKSADDEPTADLAQILEAEPSKRGPILKYLLDMTNQLIQKKMTGFTMLHDAMLQYFLCVRPGSDEHKEFMELIKGDEGGDLLKNMAFTKSGARLVCLLLAYSSAKDRKVILKTYKDTFQLLCGDPHGHVVVLAAYDLIDDTVLSSKTIFPELLGKNEEKGVENVLFCASDPNARTTVLYLFEGASRSLFPGHLATDLEILAEIHEIRKTTSKKDPETRRKELVAAASPQLLAALAASPRELVATPLGCQLVADVLLYAVGDKTAALTAIASTAEGDPDVGEAEPADSSSAIVRPAHVSRNPAAARMFKTLVAGGRFDKELGAIKLVDPPLGFADTLYAAIKDYVVAWATGPGSFVPLALLETESFSHGSELLKTLRKNKALLEKAATEETAEQKAKREGTAGGAAREEASVDETNKKTKKKKAAPKQEQHARERAVGNAGARLLLEKL